MTALAIPMSTETTMSLETISTAVPMPQIVPGDSKKLTMDKYYLSILCGISEKNENKIKWNFEKKN